VVIWDLASGTKKKDEGGDAPPPFAQEGRGRKLGATSWKDWTYNVDKSEPLLGLQFSGEQMRFGLVMLKERDPNDSNKYKRLTFMENGQTNNTCVRIQGDDYLFGHEQTGVRYVRNQKSVPLEKPRIGRRSVMTFPGDIKVTQHVELVPSEQSGRIDTCLIYYTIENMGTTKREVGLRLMLDTFIGANDGVPFAIPGKGLVKDKREFTQKEVPDYIEALEKPDLKNPGTVVHLGLKGIRLPGVSLDPVSKVFIGKFEGSEQRYELKPGEKESITQGTPDSCVWMYWPELTLNGGEKREMAITYGLGAIAVQGGSGQQQMALTVGGDFQPGKEFVVTAYVQNPRDGQKVKIDLPSGLTLAEGESPEKSLEKGDYSQVSWRVHSSEAGAYTVKAESEKLQASKSVRIKSSGIFN
jgi:hypothetical protein